MPIIESLENRALQWAFQKYLLNALRHWKTTLAGVITLISALGMTLNYVQQCIANPSALDVAHIGSIGTVYAIAFGLISGKDMGTTDVAFDSNGLAIPKGETVK